MSNFGSWPNYRIRIVRSLGEFVWAAARLSWRIDRVGVPVMLPTCLLVFYLKGEF